VATSGHLTENHSPGLGTKLAYGFGSTAYGIKDGGLKFLLLIFYAQVIGLDSTLVSLAIFIALIADAFTDPLVGYWSDNFKSRWGRRHPFMYAAAVPVAVSYYFIWNPPEGWSDMGLFWYIVILTIIIRTFITFYETPSTALAPELSSDYDERSRILSFRYFFGWAGGNIMTVITFAAIFPAFATAAYPNGQFNPDAYPAYALVAASLMFAAILISALGTHSYIPHLRRPVEQSARSLGTVFREIYETVSSRSFFALFFASLLGFTGSGYVAGLSFYMYTFFWEFSPEQVGLLTAAIFISAIIGGILAPLVTRKWDKKKGAVAVGLVAFIWLPMPAIMRLADILPANGSPALFWIILIATTIDVALIICYQILAASMMADLVEQGELKTGKRSEGMFFAAVTFMRKFGEGFGIVLAGLVLSLIGLQTGAQPGEVSDESLWNLGFVYALVSFVLYMMVIKVISNYRIDRVTHEDSVRKLADGR